MFEIKQVNIPEIKACICNTILRALPSWFGVEASIIDYVDKTQSMPFWAAYDGEKPIGFVALKIHNPHASEVCVMGILKEYHRQGIGRKLIGQCESFCSEQHTEYLTVKTLDGSAPSISYAKTREFYLAVGFLPLEVFPLHWDKDNPCLFMVKYLPHNCVF
jgi:GNAT superfamily N-acetyltransferase